MNASISVGIRSFNMRVMNKKGLSGWLLLALVFFLLAVFAGIFGFGLIAGASFSLAKWMVIIFIVLLIISIIAHTIKTA